MEMRRITNEIIEEIEDLKAMMMKELSKEDVFTSASPEGIVAIQKSFKLIDRSGELMKEYVNILESQDKKLDMILEKLEERS